MKLLGEILAFVELLAAWLLLSLRYASLPPMIRSPFNGGGDAHGFGDKNQLWLLVILALFLYLLLTGIGRLDLSLNLPEATTPRTRAAVLSQVLTTLLAVKILVMTLFFLQIFFATGISTSVPSLMTHRATIFPLLFAILFVSVCGFVAGMIFTLKKNKA